MVSLGISLRGVYRYISHELPFFAFIRSAISRFRARLGSKFWGSHALTTAVCKHHLSSGFLKNAQTHGCISAKVSELARHTRSSGLWRPSWHLLPPLCRLCRSKISGGNFESLGWMWRRKQKASTRSEDSGWGQIWVPSQWYVVGSRWWAVEGNLKVALRTELHWIKSLTSSTNI